MPAWRLTELTIALLFGASMSAQADVAISNKATANMSCVSGVCTAIAQKAVLNVSELQTMLASSDVTVKTGALAKDVEIAQPLTWSSTSRLTLNAQQSVVVKKQITVAGAGALTVTTNDGGKHGEFIIVPERGSVQFWDLASSFIIKKRSYTLVGDIKTLAADIAANPSGFYALAKPYDASADGTYSSAPVATKFSGVFDGLGNAVANLSLHVTTGQGGAGLFASVDTTGSIRHAVLVNANAEAFSGVNLGFLVGDNRGQIERSAAKGKAVFNAGIVGGLVGGNNGTVRDSYADVRLCGDAAYLGGLVANNNGGTITRSFALGSVALRNEGGSAEVGGLVGINSGAVENSFSRSKVIKGKQTNGAHFGGLVGFNDHDAIITSSYDAGLIKNAPSAGGLVGFDFAPAGHIASSYWDLDMGIGDPSQGAANIDNDPGIIGLTTEQLQSGLPAGFDPKFWGSDPNINKGYPYLLANPPQKCARRATTAIRHLRNEKPRGFSRTNLFHYRSSTTAQSAL